MKTYHQHGICVEMNVGAVHINFSLSFVRIHTQTRAHIWQLSEVEEEDWAKWHLKQNTFVALLRPLSCCADVCKGIDVKCAHAHFWADFLTITEMSLSTCTRTSAIREQQVTEMSAKASLRWFKVAVLTFGSEIKDPSWHFLLILHQIWKLN